jgi:hypothetical protein
MIRKLFNLLVLLCFTNILVAQQTDPESSPFEIRGVLPWHNFLSGPTAWNLDDYEEYLDWCRELGVNLVVFHNYTGGGERYVNYVEPMIRIQYKNVLPHAEFDHSGTARWGYLPMKVNDFAYGTGELFDLPEGAEYFGSDAAVLPKTNEERYDQAQTLMQQVLSLAHERDMQMAMGFEFGVAPPEYASVRTGETYWTGSGSLVYNPFDPDAIGILYATIDDILETYEGLDQIWLWLNEHTMFGVDLDVALRNEAMAAYFEENSGYYEGEEITESMQFLGVWAQAYILRAWDYIRKRSPETKVVISGWGSRVQLTPLLGGLHEALPEEITFSVLSPGQGEYPHPDVFREITKEREVWAIPWLEGDRSLWHLQPRVEKMRDHAKLAREDDLNGVIGIHWRTEEIRDNFDALFHFTMNPDDPLSTKEFYQGLYRDIYGDAAAERVAPLMAQIDRDEVFRDIPSPDYFAYRPSYGRLSEEQLQIKKKLIEEIDTSLEETSGEDHIDNLKWLRANLEIALLLDEIGRRLEPAWNLRNDVLAGRVAAAVEDRSRFADARDELDKAPVRELFELFATRVRSRGELGGLSSLNQRVWGEIQMLSEFLREGMAHSE